MTDGIWDSPTWDDGVTIWSQPNYVGSLLWAIEIDWDGDGFFDGQNEAVNCVSLQIERGKQNSIRLDGNGEASGFSYVEPGTCNIVLDNSSGRYNPRNGNSPLFPNVRPGKLAQISVTYLGVTYPRFAGRLVDIRVVSPDRVSISMIDGMRELSERDTNVALHKAIKISDAVDLILDDISWPTVWGRSIDATGDSLPYWWTQGQRALSELRDLADADTGAIFCNAEGAATYISRNHTGASVVTLTEADMLKEILLPNPWDVIRNDIRVTARPRKAHTVVEVWRLQETPLLSFGEVKKYFATTSYLGEACPVDNVITPASLTDYTANTAADGSGTDLTGLYAVTVTPLGSVVLITVTASATGYLTLLKLRADAIVKADEVTIQRLDATSQAIYGTLKFNLVSPWLQGLNTIEPLGDWLKTYLQIATNLPQIQIQQRPDIQFAADLFDNVDATFEKQGLNSATYRVVYINERWLSDNGQSVLTELHLEPYVGLPVYWIFDAVMQVTTIFPP